MSLQRPSHDPLLQPLLLGQHTLPGIWRYTMPQEFQALRLPEERRSTCMSCPKITTDRFRADYRCCTYQPRVPNYLLGLALATTPGQQALGDAAAKGFLLPEGMQQTPQQWYHYLQDLTDESFGKSRRVLCPMLEPSSGLCRIHAFRNSVCSTFFCLRDHGAVSERFWNQVQSLGSQIEMILSQWVMRELGFDLNGYIATLNQWGQQCLAHRVHDKDLADGWSERFRKQLWRDWYGRELDFYRQAGQLVSEHRHHLWDIANHNDIVEAKAFDRAMIAAVPKALDSQVEESDRDISDEEEESMVPPQELWADLLKTYQKLWNLPAGTYRLARKVSLAENAKDDPEAKLYQEQGFCLTMHEAPRSRAIDWRLFLSKDQYELLRGFTEARSINWQTLIDPKLNRINDVRSFLLEMIANRVLVKLNV